MALDGRKSKNSRSEFVLKQPNDILRPVEPFDLFASNHKNYDLITIERMDYRIDRSPTVSEIARNSVRGDYHPELQMAGSHFGNKVFDACTIYWRVPVLAFEHQIRRKKWKPKRVGLVVKKNVDLC